MRRAESADKLFGVRKFFYYPERTSMNLESRKLPICYLHLRQKERSQFASKLHLLNFIFQSKLPPCAGAGAGGGGTSGARNEKTSNGKFSEKVSFRQGVKHRLSGLSEQAKNSIKKLT
jgi:hypothetical protein